MYKYILTIIISCILIISLSQTSKATGLYSEPEFRGKVIDAETKQPIEGTVVVVLYYKRSVVSLNPGGPSSYVTKAKETLTDNKGEFYFPSYSELLLFTEDTYVEFIFYKPGYMASHGPKNVVSREEYFSSDVIGKEGEIHAKRGRPASYKGPMGIVELKKVSPEKAMSPGHISDDYGPDQLPLYYKAIEEDLINRGILKGGKKQ
ncbi:MAG: hypothetical protein JW976_02995 [Syntrophaceae bacterium]|nr:hypothetical protein [Syntrophaceae bacterium]